VYQDKHIKDTIFFTPGGASEWINYKPLDFLYAAEKEAK